jgi:hypothetical protein
VPPNAANKATTELSSGLPFVSDAQLKSALDRAAVPKATTKAIVKENSDARIAGLHSALALLAVVGLLAVYFSRRLPKAQPAATNAGPA